MSVNQEAAEEVSLREGSGTGTGRQGAPAVAGDISLPTMSPLGPHGCPLLQVGVDFCLLQPSSFRRKQPLPSKIMDRYVLVSRPGQDQTWEPEIQSPLAHLAGFGV